MAEDVEIRRKRLLYRATHRGFREADLLIGGFAKTHLDNMSEAELNEFEALLGVSDHDLYAWATGAGEPPANLAGPVFDRLRAFDVASLVAPS
ncbi:MAG: succinate dehydrogenase assembly factor 2 [Parvularculaceae bacterium]